MRSRRKSMLCWVILWLVCGSAVGLAQTPTAEPIKIGALHSETYPYATMMKNSLEMALASINASGGIKGRPLSLVYADDQGQRQPGEAAVQALVKQSGAVMLVGAYQSSNALYMGRMAEELNIPLLVSTAADDRITQRKWRNIYRLNSPAGEYTKGLEDLFLNRISPTSMAIIYENSPYGTGGALRMLWFCREHGIEIKSIIPYHKERANSESNGGAYFDRLLSPLKVSPPDVIYMVSYLKDGALLVKTIDKIKINALLCGGAGGFTHQKFLALADDSAEGLLTATLWTPHLRYPGTEDYYRQYLERYSTPPDYHGAEAYSALLVAADALERAETLSPKAIRAAMDATDLTTPFGPIKFATYDNFHRQNSLPTQVLQVINGQYHCIWPKDLASSEFEPPASWRQQKP